MHNHPSRFKIFLKKLKKNFIFIHIFLCSCSTEPFCKKIHDQKQIECFLKKFLFEEGGAYTLFGDKPMTDIAIFIGTEKDICVDGLSEEALNQIVYKEDDTAQNWKAWKEFSKRLKTKNFLFAERPCPFDPLHSLYCFVNIEKVREVFEKHKDAFTKKIGREVDFAVILEEIKDPTSFLWNKILQDHYLSGLLHGYGEENIQQFIEQVANNSNPAIKFSNEETPPLDSISLPVYALAENDITLDKYREQREKIKKIYQNKDFLQVTLRQLEK